MSHLWRVRDVKIMCDAKNIFNHTLRFIPLDCVYVCVLVDLPKRDMCKTSENGTMDLYLEPPWAFPQIMSYFSYNVTLLEDTPEGEGAKVEQPEQPEEPEQSDDGWSFF